MNKAQARIIDDDVVAFWEDVYPVENGRRVRGVPMTVDGFLEWLERDPRLEMSKPSPGTIGSDLPATIVNVTVSSEATNEEPGCPTSASCGSATRNGRTRGGSS